MADLHSETLHLHLLLLAALGGGVGSCIRVAIRDEVVARGYASWRGTLFVNVVGCAIAIGCMGLAVGTSVWALVVAGALGGFTTFSSFAIEMIASWMVRGTRSVHGRAWSAAAGAGALRSRRVPHYLRGLAAIFAGAIVGCGLRTWFDLAAVEHGFPPWQATLTVNVLGSTVAGVAFRLLHAVGPDGAPLRTPLHRLILERATILGFAGGLTSMSALATDLVGAARSSAWLFALIACANLVLGLAGAALGWWIAARVARHRPPWETLLIPPRSRKHE